MISFFKNKYAIRIVIKDMNPIDIWLNINNIILKCKGNYL